MKITKEMAEKMSKHGIDLLVYPILNEAVDLVTVSVEQGHFQEFYHKDSTFIYYIIEGAGTFFLNGEPTSASAGDVIVVPPLTKIYYLGTMKMVLVTTPAWKEEGEVHVRDIPRE